MVESLLHSKGLGEKLITGLAIFFSIVFVLMLFHLAIAGWIWPSMLRSQMLPVIPTLTKPLAGELRCMAPQRVASFKPAVVTCVFNPAETNATSFTARVTVEGNPAHAYLLPEHSDIPQQSIDLSFSGDTLQKAEVRVVNDGTASGLLFYPQEIELQLFDSQEVPLTAATTMVFGMETRFMSMLRDAQNVEVSEKSPIVLVVAVVGWAIKLLLDQKPKTETEPKPDVQPADPLAEVKLQLADLHKQEASQAPLVKARNAIQPSKLKKLGLEAELKNVDYLISLIDSPAGYDRNRIEALQKAGLDDPIAGVLTYNAQHCKTEADRNTWRNALREFNYARCSPELVDACLKARVLLGKEGSDIVRKWPKEAISVKWDYRFDKPDPFPALRAEEDGQLFSSHELFWRSHRIYKGLVGVDTSLTRAVVGSPGAGKTAFGQALGLFHLDEPFVLGAYLPVGVGKTLQHAAVQEQMVGALQRFILTNPSHLVLLNYNKLRMLGRLVKSVPGTTFEQNVHEVMMETDYPAMGDGDAENNRLLKVEKQTQLRRLLSELTSAQDKPLLENEQFGALVEIAQLLNFNRLRMTFDMQESPTPEQVEMLTGLSGMSHNFPVQMIVFLPALSYRAKESFPTTMELTWDRETLRRMVDYRLSTAWRGVPPKKIPLRKLTNSQQWNDLIDQAECNPRKFIELWKGFTPDLRSL